MASWTEHQRFARHPTVRIEQLLATHAGDSNRPGDLPRVSLHWEATVADVYLSRPGGSYHLEVPRNDHAVTAFVYHTPGGHAVEVLLGDGAWLQVAAFDDGVLRQLRVLDWYRRVLRAGVLGAVLLEAGYVSGRRLLFRPTQKKVFSGQDVATELDAALPDRRVRSGVDAARRALGQPPSVQRSARLQLALLFLAVAEAGLCVAFEGLALQPTLPFVLRTRRFDVPVQGYLLRARLSGKPLPVTHGESVQMILNTPGLAQPPGATIQIDAHYRPDPAPFRQAAHLLGLYPSADAAPTPSDVLQEVYRGAVVGSAVGDDDNGTAATGPVVNALTPSEAVLAWIADNPAVNTTPWA